MKLLGLYLSILICMAVAKAARFDASLYASNGTGQITTTICGMARVVTCIHITCKICSSSSKLNQTKMVFPHTKCPFFYKIFALHAYHTSIDNCIYIRGTQQGKTEKKIPAANITRNKTKQGNNTEAFPISVSLCLKGFLEFLPSSVSEDYL